MATGAFLDSDIIVPSPQNMGTPPDSPSTKAQPAPVRPRPKNTGSWNSYQFVQSRGSSTSSQFAHMPSIDANTVAILRLRAPTTQSRCRPCGLLTRTLPSTSTACLCRPPSKAPSVAQLVQHLAAHPALQAPVAPQQRRLPQCAGSPQRGAARHAAGVADARDPQLAGAGRARRDGAAG